MAQIKNLITDAAFEEIKASLNNAIHELVFACKHVEEDQVEDAAQCLMTAQSTIDIVANRLVDLGG